MSDQKSEDQPKQSLREMVQEIADLGPVTPIMVKSRVGHHYFAPGLTKREFFAAMVFQGMIGNQRLMDMFAAGTPGLNQEFSESVARRAVQHADALLKSLEEKKS